MRLRKVLRLLALLLFAMGMLSCSSTHMAANVGPNAQATSGATPLTGVPVKVRPNAPLISSETNSTLTRVDTPFRSYDKAVLEKINVQWKALLAKASREKPAQPGEVVVEFRLIYDGTVTDLVVTKNEVGEPFGSISKQAIVDSAPFPSWPSDMRRMIGGNFREVTFTFYHKWSSFVSIGGSLVP